VALTLHFVRHGKAQDMDGFCIGHTDRALTDQGRDEIESLARRLDVQDIACISSDLVRASASAERLTMGHVTTEPRLREMHFGTWEGRTWAELEATDGPGVQEWMADWTNVRAPGGESFADVIVRVRSWLDSLARDDTRLLVVAHAGSIRAAAVVLLDLPPARSFLLQIDHAQVCTFVLSSHGASLRTWNSRTF